MIDEAAGAGVIEQEESRMIAGVMRTADRTARGVLTPRHEVEIADARETRQQILERFRMPITVLLMSESHWGFHYFHLLLY